MVEPSELLRVPAFADLPEDQLAWFLSQSEELQLKAGDILSHQGDPADWMLVLLEGELQGRGDFGGEPVFVSITAGQVTGRLPFSRMKQISVGFAPSGTAWRCDFPPTKFPLLVQTMPELTTRLVGLMTDRVREVHAPGTAARPPGRAR